jgi:preprotein translocase subunit SecG
MNALYLIQILISTLLIAVVLIQSKGGGLGSAWGGTQSYHSKRGLEKVLFRFTIGLATAFIFVSLLTLI